MDILTAFKKGLGLGLVLGVSAGAAYAATRTYQTESATMIDWTRVRQVANRVCDRYGGPARIAERKAAEYEYRAMVELSGRLVSEYVGEAVPQPPEFVHVFDRKDWIDSNIHAFARLFEPLEKMNQDTLRRSPVAAQAIAAGGQLLLNSQVGLLLGYLSLRVLGQYDLALLGKEPISAGKLYFVEPNIAMTQRRLGLDERQFRLWIALHETTHAYQFEAHPWLRDYMNDLLQQSFATLGPGPKSQDWFKRVKAGIRTGNVLELLMTSEQARIFDKLQALMSLLEGYSNHVMQQVGGQVLPDYALISRRFEDRLKERSFAERLFSKLTGLELKREQYILGERFVAAVVGARGIAFMNQVWRSPNALPTLDDVRNPDRWVQRLDEGVGLAS